jgi:hypothetical protein
LNEKITFLNLSSRGGCSLVCSWLRSESADTALAVTPSLSGPGLFTIYPPTPMRTALRLLLVTAVVALSSTLAYAQFPLATFDGDTTGDPTWNRPSTVGTGTSGSCTLSGVGTDVSYETHTFTTDITGDYLIQVVGVDPGYDTYLLLYEGSFDPTDQCQNLIALDDDDGTVNVSTIGAGSYSGRTPLTLLAGQEYTIVVSGFSTTGNDFGPYDGTISGPAGATITFTSGGGTDYSLFASATPATITYGEDLSIRVTFTNRTDDSLRADIWLDVTREGFPIVVTEYVGTRTVPPDTTVSHVIVRPLPQRFGGRTIQPGVYTVVVNAGDFDTNTVLASDPFLVTVTATARTAGEMAGPATEAITEEKAKSEPSPTAPPSHSLAATDGVAVSPNPFAHRATLSFTLAEASDVRLAVYDVLGREVATLVGGRVEAGVHQAAFDGSALAPGLYVYRLTADGTVYSGRMTLAR